MGKLIVFNHKMSLLYDDLYSYIERVNNIDTDNDIIICPSNIYLEAFVNNSLYPIGAQNLHFALDNKHTGEVSTDQLKSLGVLYSLIGHYDRVREFNENVNIVNEKLIAALDANIVPILCFGEDVTDDYRNVIPSLLDGYLKGVMNIEFIIFAYEPIYAIGTGILPNTSKISEVTCFVRKYLMDKYGKRATLIYGGSVDSSNIREIISSCDVDGALIGDISSNSTEVIRIIDSLE